jgi:hypothetical protein
MKQTDLRTPDQVFDDMLADDHPLEEIAARLSWSYAQAKSRYLRICRELGVRPDEE